MSYVTHLQGQSREPLSEGDWHAGCVWGVALKGCVGMPTDRWDWPTPRVRPPAGMGGGPFAHCQMGEPCSPLLIWAWVTGEASLQPREGIKALNTRVLIWECIILPLLFTFSDFSTFGP